MGCSTTCIKNNEKIITPYLNILIIESEINNDSLNLKSSKQTYQKIRSIGKGSYGQVFLIKSLQTQKEYALKETIITKNKEIFLYFSMNEINILSKLSNPYIVSLKCAFKTQIDEQTEKLNIIMEYVDNGDLNKLITEYKDSSKYFEEKRLLNWLFQLCLALIYLKENEIIHRDIKPSNIFLMQDDTIKLGDFGISKKKSINNDLNLFIGTPVYTSPEIIMKKEFSFKTDIWSLGVTFLQLISLHLPFVSEEEQENINENILKKKLNKEILNKEKNDFNDDINKKYSKTFLNLIDQMVSINPEQRPSVNDILNNIMIKQRMKEYLNENNFDEIKVDKMIEDIDIKIKEIYNIINNINNNEKNSNNSGDKKNKEKIKEMKNLIKKEEFLKKMIIINNSVKKEFKSIEVV